MKNTQRSIFREVAIRRYIEGKETSVLPRLVSPRTFVYLWSLLGLLTASSFVAWFTKVPVYASGSAMVVRLNNRTRDPTIAFVAFFPARYLTSLQNARTLFLKFDAMGDDRFSRSMIKVEPQIYSPDAIQKQFALNARTAQTVTQPSAVVVAALLEKNAPEQLQTLPASTLLGSVGHAEVEVESQQMISLLPLIGKNFEP